MYPLKIQEEETEEGEDRKWNHPLARSIKTGQHDKLPINLILKCQSVLDISVGF